MSNAGLVALTFVAALGSGLVAGVFFTFSAFVMPGLARLSPAQAVSAMQSVNVTAVRPPLMTALFGTAACCVGLVVVALASWGEDWSVPLLVGSLLYLLGDVLLTITYHVPRNDRLASVEPTDAAAAALWETYLRDWTRLNHVRAGTALLAAAAFTWALRL